MTPRRAPTDESLAGLYLRLSEKDKGQNESESIDNQRKLLLGEARRRGFRVVDCYVDAAAIIGLNQNPITTGADLVLFFLVFSQKTRRMEDVTA